MARVRKNEELEVEEANVLPVMNIMFLLIPALLLAMEVASLAAIAVSPPKFAAAPSDKKEEEKKEEKPLKFKVFILSDGFRVSTAAQQEGAEAGKEQDSSGPSIPLAKPGADATDYERYDYAALEAKAKELKDKAKHETVVTISAENDIPMQVLISTMDAVRGTDCKLVTLTDDDEIPEECLFFQPIVEAGAG
ncbi:Biopolymer transport protein ExbD/TolR [Enhygromyxa salina]|uniref:Biopolymer transport protein ExbD/TolR n=1 Tax=Enhygromyxa salina TaxID=215803 RepID=A0A2S9XEQ6_9BACT|nr:biopolymer transporter ExbD [Enhygromyxa salina]PRP91327.1 Biopolymer transport protein ExbD/TolR [Enhygromyxa salina]